MHLCFDERDTFVLRCRELNTSQLILDCAFFEDFHFKDEFEVEVKFCPFCGYHNENYLTKEG